ncbi:unnamed protein product, partial [Rotaria magnacalcarata]
DQNPSLDVEHPGAQKTCRSSEHKRLKTGNCGNKSGNIANCFYTSMMSEYLPQLTLGGLNEYISGRKNDCATLQVLDLKSIKEKAGDNSLTGKRYRLILSDGRHFFSSCVLGTDTVDLVKNDILKINSVIRLNHVDVCNAGVNSSRVILVVQDLTVVLSDCEKIGNPVQINDINIAHTRVDLLNVPISQTVSNVTQSGSTGATSSSGWQVDDIDNFGLLLTESLLNTTEICSISDLDSLRSRCVYPCENFVRSNAELDALQLRLKR